MAGYGCSGKGQKILLLLTIHENDDLSIQSMFSSSTIMLVLRPLFGLFHPLPNAFPNAPAPL